MRSEEIRKTFLDFFAEKGHKIVPSAPIVVKNDPTLLFTNAGMNQFKDYFLGNKVAPDKCVADTQKCLRVSGKHNDLEEVGIDTYHHTMFEMLGNWSFGDYFKKEAISWAWELLTERFKMDKDRLYVTIFEGDDKEGLAEDTDSLEIWRGLVQEDHILRGSKKDNFWEMGDTGPCGPCTEIHYDIRTEEERQQVPGSELVNNDHPQVIEIWNNVFIEFNRKADGKLEVLPAQHVDTGMGFERLTRVLQGKHSNYDTDIFQPLIRKMEIDLHVQYGNNEQQDIALRVIADHIRAVTFTIADGQLPSNTGAGYVIRRILRRAVRYGYTFLNMEDPYIHNLVTVLAQQFKNVFPEVIKQEDFIKKVIQEEEASFLRTLASGIRLFEKHVSTLADNTISGKFAFELYDTYGFPFDLTELMAREKSYQVDTEGFKAELQKQKERSRNAAAKQEGDWMVLQSESGPTQFLGYDQTEAEVKIVRYRQVAEKGKTVWQLVLDQTPFYPEGGGQVGDTGALESPNEAIMVINTYRENDLIIHVTESLPELLDQSFHARVDTAKRMSTANNHTATHLLHAALRRVLGTHVAQKGSLVTDKYLRFDFSHFAKMTDDEIAWVEHIVNEKIRENIPLLEERAVPFAEAQNRGAMALFGEKYGEQVRMITFDPQYSVELCGGIHVNATGRLGFFKILSEGAVAAGVRRIEAVTGAEAERIINQEFALSREMREMLKNPKDLRQAVEQLRESGKEAQQHIENLQRKNVGLEFRLMEMEIQLENNNLQKEEDTAVAFAKWAEKNNYKEIIAKEIPLSHDENIDKGRLLAMEIAQRTNFIVLLGARMANRASIWLSIPDRFLKEIPELNAGQIIKDISKEIEGGGGGQKHFASASGKNPNGLEAALSKGFDIITSKLV